MAASNDSERAKYYEAAGISQRNDERRQGPYHLIDIYASIPTMTRGKPVLIGGDPKGNNITYCCGNSVVIRNLKEPLLADTYGEHQKNPTVARYSPSGFYIASADESGTVRIWDTVQAGHGLKGEYRPIAGRAYDIAWTEDSKRLAVVGEGREKFGAVFFMDGGASVGEIKGHSKAITSVDIKQTRPFRLMTGGEDNATCWFHGPPFKWQKTNNLHTRFVNCVRFNKQGTHLISVGQDKQGLIYDGKTGEHVGKLDSEHKGGVYCVSWNAEGTQVLTASADRTCKIWDVETKKAITTFQFDSAVEYQQLGCLWQGDYLLSIGLNGYLNYLDPSSGKVAKTVYGHQNFVHGLAYHKEGDAFYSGSYDSVQVRWNVKDASNSLFEGANHQNQINQLSIDGSTIYSAGVDDAYGFSEVGEGKSGGRVGTDSPALGIDAANGIAVGVSMKSISLIRGGKEVARVKDLGFDPTAVAVSPDGATAAVGGSDNHIHLYTVSGDSLTAAQVLKNHARPISALSFSPSGQYLASGCKNRSIICWKTADWQEHVDGHWVYHAAAINHLAWSPDSRLLASAGLDQDIYVWAPEKKMRRLKIPLAHRGGVNSVAWTDNTTFVSSGQDATLRTWSVEFPF